MIYHFVIYFISLQIEQNPLGLAQICTILGILYIKSIQNKFQNITEHIFSAVMGRFHRYSAVHLVVGPTDKVERRMVALTTPKIRPTQHP